MDTRIYQLIFEILRTERRWQALVTNIQGMSSDTATLDSTLFDLGVFYFLNFVIDESDLALETVNNGNNTIWLKQFGCTRVPLM